MLKNPSIMSMRVAIQTMTKGSKALAFVAVIMCTFCLYTLTGGSVDQAELNALRVRLAEFEKAQEVRMGLVVNKELDKLRATMQNQESKLYPPTTTLAADEQKRILVTGGAGFVGSNLVDRLMAQGHEVTVLDNFFTGRRENVEHWMGHPHFNLVEHDVVEPYMQQVHQIYHLACPASPPMYQYNPIKTIKTSAMGTLNMLGLAKRVKARLLFTSTSEVYGDPLVHPQTESYWGNVNPIGPRACYDEGKRVAETMCYSYMHEAAVEVRVARIFNTFGPRMHPNDGRVVSNFIIQALKGKPLSVYGDGMQTRSFQYVSDLVEGLMALMNSDNSDPTNIGNPVETTILDFAKFIQAEVNPDATIMHKPATEDDPSKRKPDISRAKERLGWAPKVDIKTGIGSTVKYFKQQLDPKLPKTTIWI